MRPIEIEDADWARLSIREKVLHYIDTPAIKEDYRLRNDFWSDILQMECGGYNSAVDEHVLIVLEESNTQQRYTSDIAEKNGWPEEYVELIKYILCGAGLCEYGTSPRGAFIEHSIQELLPQLIKRARIRNK